MRISDWSSDVCSSDLFRQVALSRRRVVLEQEAEVRRAAEFKHFDALCARLIRVACARRYEHAVALAQDLPADQQFAGHHVIQAIGVVAVARQERSEERRVGKEGVSTCRSRWLPYH